MSNLSIPQGHPDMPKTGNTRLSIKASGGHIWVVDQDGFMVDGVISVKAHTAIDELTTLEIKCYSHDETVK